MLTKLRLNFSVVIELQFQFNLAEIKYKEAQKKGFEAVIRKY